MKTCKRCGADKELSEFTARSTPKGKLLYASNCKNCRSVVQSYMQMNNKQYLFNMRYNSMLKRVRGTDITYHSFVEGMPILSRSEYRVWLDNNMMTFDVLYDAWKESGFERRLAPSIDRIDSKRSYVADNMQWLSMGDNSSKRNK